MGFEPSPIIISRPAHTVPHHQPYFLGLLNTVFGPFSVLFTAVIIMPLITIIHGAPYLAKVMLSSLLTFPQLVPRAALLRLL